MPQPLDEIGPAGRALAANIRRIRGGQGLTYAALSRRLAETGRQLPPLSLRRIETGRRRVDYDDLLCLALALRVTVVDLMVPSTTPDDGPWPVTPTTRLPAGRVRAWVAGQPLLNQPAQPGELMEAIRWMPQQRAREMVRAMMPPGSVRP